jgi:hypothetical protein
LGSSLPKLASLRLGNAPLTFIPTCDAGFRGLGNRQIMDLKPRPNHQEYLRVLSRMTPDEKLRKVFELNDTCQATLSPRLA